ncbi:hypothetical protein SCUP515_08797 [Seiridium cupressi]
MWDYSGCSLACFFAAELQASYAPELSFAGAAMGGLPSNVTQLFATINGGSTAGFIVSILLGVTAEFPAVRDYLTGDLKTEGSYNAIGFLACLHYDALEFLTTYAGQDIFEYLLNGKDILTGSELACVIGNNAFPTYHGIPQIPLFVDKAIPDELTSIESTDRHIQRYCDAYADVLYQRNTVGSHDAESLNGAPRAFEWLARRLDGNTTQFISGCTAETVTVDLS